MIAYLMPRQGDSYDVYGIGALLNCFRHLPIW